MYIYLFVYRPISKSRMSAEHRIGGKMVFICGEKKEGEYLNYQILISVSLAISLHVLPLSISLSLFLLHICPSLSPSLSLSIYLNSYLNTYF